MAFTEEFSAFFNEDDFAVEATLTPSVGSPVTCKGIFDNDYYAIDGGEVNISSSQPRFLLPSSVNAKPGDGLTIATTAYKVVDVQPDGTGITLLILRKN